jgi:hypothetical protein
MSYAVLCSPKESTWPPRLTKHYAMKAYRGLKVHLHPFLTLSLDTGSWSASRPDYFTPRKMPPVQLSISQDLPRRLGDNDRPLPLLNIKSRSLVRSLWITVTLLAEILRTRIQKYRVICCARVWNLVSDFQVRTQTELFDRVKECVGV